MRLREKAPEESACRFGTDCPLDFAVAPVIANHSGARRARHGAHAGSVSEPSLDAPKRSRKIEARSGARSSGMRSFAQTLK